MKKLHTSNLKATKQMFGPDICSLHALLGCDTTSCLYGIGMGLPFKKFKANSIFREQAKMCDTQSASTHNLIGEKALVILYTMESQLTPWTPSGISVSVRTWLQSHLMLKPHTLTIDLRSSKVPQPACVSANLRMEGVHKWTSSNKLGMTGVS